MELQLLLTTTLIMSSFAQECHVPGDCNGYFVGLTEEPDYNGCLKTCQASDRCNWFTYTEDIDTCVQYANCTVPLDTTCGGCYSGEKDCDPEVNCEVQGFCDGFILDLDVTEDSKACLEFCQTVPECRWYSFFPDTNYCVLTEDCTIDTSCTNCVAGERQCYQETIPFGKLLVIGGTGPASYHVELIDLADDNSTCPSFPDYPGASEGSVSTFIDGRVLVCGGCCPTAECYYFDTASHAWVQTVSMTVARDYAAAAHITPTDWWVSGGSSLSSSEVYSQGSFDAFADLPESKSLHNLLRVNSTHHVLLGGNPTSNEAWIFDGSEWTPLPHLLESRLEAAAGVVTYPDGRVAVVVAGGYASLTSEILFLEGLLEWRYGPMLPLAGSELHEAASVPYGDSFLIVGGHDGETARMIHLFDQWEEEWVELPQRMQLGRLYATATLVPDDFAECA